MKDWEFVLFWFAFLTTIELGFYGRYYLFFYEPDVPFRLVQVWHSSTSGVNWNDEEYGWHYTIQYVWYEHDRRNVTLEDVHIDWERSTLAIDKPFYQHESRFIKQLVRGENFTVWTRSDHVDVIVTYHFTLFHGNMPEPYFPDIRQTLRLRAVTS